MLKLLFILLALTGYDWQEYILDKAELLSPKEVKALNSRCERIEDQAKIEFALITTGNNPLELDEFRETDIDDYQILIHINKKSVQITAGAGIIEQVSQSQLDKFATSATDYLIEKGVYGSFDWSINNITHTWLTDYYNDAKTKRQAYTALAIFMAFFAFFLFRFSKAFDPLTKQLIKRMEERRERERRFVNRNPFD